MKTAPRGIRIIIALVGRRNAGKSSLINALTGQETAIVSDVPGTTTDPVAKPYELIPVGPVTFYDTAGLDDTGELGEKRMRATRKILWRADMAIMVTEQSGLTPADVAMIDQIRALAIPCVVVFNKMDRGAIELDSIQFCTDRGIDWIGVSAMNGSGVDELKHLVIQMAPPELREDPVLAGDLFTEGDTVVLVTPIDLAAPKGRLILPQVQVIREILDGDAVAVVVKERELEAALRNLSVPPALVITDSQVVLKVAGDTPDSVPLTTFSILFARHKGDLAILANGAQAIDRLHDGDRVLMAEACSHHVQADDIGRVKIPRWITQYSGRDLQFDVSTGYDFPDNLGDYKLVIHCGSCMLNRMEMIRRIRECQRRNVPITNYGVGISKVQGVLRRVLAPFGLEVDPGRV
ncbi:[FeFe] hydrogenase H-cluster maturation GTPase HydF [bacterium]|nr:[FeFe] hydrogenase H-cluster maturation GTPase HydF [candidate division CSSED10-310 bacterium]